MVQGNNARAKAGAGAGAGATAMAMATATARATATAGVTRIPLHTVFSDGCQIGTRWMSDR